jgi:putative intracellular protease/amidase
MNMFTSTEGNDMKILMVLTSHDRLGNTGRKTGFWLEEFAAPYYAFKDAGAEVTLVSPKGGQPPLDPKSDEPGAQTAATRRFKADDAAQHALAHTGRLADVSAKAFDAVFYPGGHGPLWDLADDADSIRLIEDMAAAGKPVAAVCHAPGVLRDEDCGRQAVHRRQEGNRFHQQRRSRGTAHRRRALSGGRHARQGRRPLQQGR